MFGSRIPMFPKKLLLLATVSSLITGLGFLMVYDFMIRGENSLSFGVRTNDVSSWTSLAALVFAIALIVWRKLDRIRSIPWQRRGWMLVVLLLLPSGLAMIEMSVYEPIKFTYLIHRVENARTVEAERVAFDSARRLGSVWEINRLTERKWWPERYRTQEGDWLLELEWLESGWNGRPYRAYRVVLDETNSTVFR